MNYEYFYGSQAESYSFIRVPRLLMKGKEFRELSTDAKLLYSLLLDCMSLSVRNGWLDEAGRVYIYYTVEEIQNDLNCGHGKACKLLAELDTVKGIGLIERKKQGQGKPTKIFVKQFAESEGHERKAEDYTPEKGKSAKRKTGVQASTKPEGNYTDPNHTENSYTDPSIVRKPLNGSHSRQRQCSKIQGLSSVQTQTQSPCDLGFAFVSEGVDLCLEGLKEQLDYPLLAMTYTDDTPDCILGLICDVLCSTSPGTRIGGETIPTPKVQTRFRELRFEHVAYVLDRLAETTTDIRNIRAYLLTALYNAPLTMGPYYAAAVRRDAAGQ